MLPTVFSSLLCSAVFSSVHSAAFLQLGFWAPLWLSWSGVPLPVLRAVRVLPAGLCSLQQQCLGLSRAGTGHSHCSSPGAAGLSPGAQQESGFGPGPTLSRVSQEKWQTFSSWPRLSCQNYTTSNDVGGIEQTVLEDSPPFFPVARTGFDKVM